MRKKQSKTMKQKYKENPDMLNNWFNSKNTPEAIKKQKENSCKGKFNAYITNCKLTIEKF
jgi:hypothetical protein